MLFLLVPSLLVFVYRQTELRCTGSSGPSRGQPALNKPTWSWERKTAFSFPARLLKHLRGSDTAEASPVCFKTTKARAVNSRNTSLSWTGSIKAHWFPGSETTGKVVYICNLFKTSFWQIHLYWISFTHFYARELKFSRTSLKQLWLHHITAFLDLHQHTLAAASHAQSQPTALGFCSSATDASNRRFLKIINTTVKRKANIMVLTCPQHFTTDADLKLAQSSAILVFPCETSWERIHAGLWAAGSDRIHQHTGFRLCFVSGKDGQRFPDRSIVYSFSPSELQRALIADAFLIDNENCKLSGKGFWFGLGFFGVPRTKPSTTCRTC